MSYAGPGRAHKYNAKRTAYAGITYDSKAEAQYAARLDELLGVGALRWWIRQVPFRLDPMLPEKVWRADFMVCHKNGDVEVHEVKGRELPAWLDVKKRWRRAGPRDLPLVMIQKGKAMEVHIGSTDAIT